MLKTENAEVIGWEHAIRGMRNPKLRRAVPTMDDVQ